MRIRARQYVGVFLLTMIIFGAVLVRESVLRRVPEIDPEVEAAERAYKLKEITLKSAQMERYANLKFYGSVFLLVCAGGSLLILSGSVGRARIRNASICTARIGPHSAIPVHYKDVRSFYPIAVNLSLAEIEASVSSSHDKAYQISRQMIEDITTYTRALAGQRSLIPGKNQLARLEEENLPAATFATPTFTDLLKSGRIAPGNPLILGYHLGQPELRDIKNLKSVAIAGWQGSGKTSSSAYMIASSVLAYGVEAYVIDPHKQHDEGLYSLIKPLESTGNVHVINPFDTPALIHQLNARLDRRLRGDESSERGILFVIDELARLAKMDCFDELVVLLERCTEETRKANIIFLGISPKWTARHFKGRADIRGCMNSALIHKCKPSQAELLLEDSQEKKLVCQLEKPGDALLVTDYAGTRPVSMPFCTRCDMETVAKMLGNGHAAEEILPSPHMWKRRLKHRPPQRQQRFPPIP